MHTPDQRRRRLVFEADEATREISQRQCHLQIHLVQLRIMTCMSVIFQEKTILPTRDKNRAFDCWVSS